MIITQFEKYVEGCLVTWNNVDDHRLLNATLGLAGEFVEFHQTLLHETRDKKIDEAGDLLYYASVIMFELKDIEQFEIRDSGSFDWAVKKAAEAIHEAYLFPDDHILKNRSYNEHDKFYATLKDVGIILEHTKKYLFHGRKLDYDLLMECTLQIVMWLFYILAEHTIELGTVMTYNFEKLSKRYPEGFKKLAER